MNDHISSGDTVVAGIAKDGSSRWTLPNHDAFGEDSFVRFEISKSVDASTLLILGT
jgi:hypothetical protein